MILEGKTAIITGGVSGIGLCCVKEYLKAGIKKIAILDLNESLFPKVAEELSSEFGPNRATIIKTDVSDEKDFEDSFDKAVKELKTVDIVHNNAGIIAEELWSKAIDVNIKGVIKGTLLGLKYMSKENSGLGGVIMNTASTAAFIYIAEIPVYTCTKYAVLGFTKSIGTPENFQETGVKIVALCPGLTNTSILKQNIYTQTPMEKKMALKFNLANIPAQELLPVAKAAIHMIQNAETGSVYVIEQSKLYDIELPRYNEGDYKTKQLF